MSVFQQRTTKVGDIVVARVEDMEDLDVPIIINEIQKYPSGNGSYIIHFQTLSEIAQDLLVDHHMHLHDKDVFEVNFTVVLPVRTDPLSRQGIVKKIPTFVQDAYTDAGVAYLCEFTKGKLKTRNGLYERK